MDAVVIVDPVQYQRRRDERDDVSMPLRSLHFGPEGGGLVTSRVGGDQGDVEGFGQGDILGVVGGQVGMKALQARPQGPHVLPFDREPTVVGERGVGAGPPD